MELTRKSAKVSRTNCLLIEAKGLHKNWLQQKHSFWICSISLQPKWPAAGGGAHGARIEMMVRYRKHWALVLWFTKGPLLWLCTSSLDDGIERCWWQTLMGRSLSPSSITAYRPLHVIDLKCQGIIAQKHNYLYSMFLWQKYQSVKYKLLKHTTVPSNLLKGDISSHFNICCCSVTKLYLSLCHPMDCSTLGFPVLHCL